MMQLSARNQGGAICYRSDFDYKARRTAHRAISSAAHPRSVRRPIHRKSG
jgi:hypothetical protein